MKRLQKTLVVILIICSIFLGTAISSVEATDKSIWDKGKDFLDKGSGAYDEEGGLKNAIGINDNLVGLVDTLWGFGLLVLFITTMTLGIRYMMVNPNEKARIKQATTPYILGVVIIFGAVTIWKLIILILEDGLLGG